MIYLKRVLSEDKRVCHGEALRLLEHALLEEYGLKPGYIIGKSENGKPFLDNYPNIYFNISHSVGMVACEVGKSTLGVDIESLRPMHPKALRRAFMENEQKFVKKSSDSSLDFFRLWTLKESYVKALGAGLSFGLKNINFDFSDSDIISKQEDFFFKQYIINDEFVLACCGMDRNPLLIKAERLEMPNDQQIYTVEKEI